MEFREVLMGHSSWGTAQSPASLTGVYDLTTTMHNLDPRGGDPVRGQ